MDPPSPVQPSDDAALDGSFSITSQETLSQNHPARLSRFLSHRNCEIMNVGCFKPRNVEVICYTALNDKQKHQSPIPALPSSTMPLDKVPSPSEYPSPLAAPKQHTETTARPLTSWGQILRQSCPGPGPPSGWPILLDHISFQTSIFLLTKAFKLKSQDFVNFLLWRGNGYQFQCPRLGEGSFPPILTRKKRIQNNSPSLGMDSSTP